MSTLVNSEEEDEMIHKGNLNIGIITCGPSLYKTEYSNLLSQTRRKNPLAYIVHQINTV